MLAFKFLHESLAPDQTGLILALANRLPSDARHYMAARDYGADVDEHRAAIDGILATGCVVGQHEWVPREVLALTRWSDAANAKGSPQLESLHIQRLFATAALLQPMAEDPLAEDAEEPTFASFVESAIFLRMQDLSLGLLTWIVKGLEASIEKEAAEAVAKGDDDFEPTDPISHDAAFLVLSILLLDRSRERPALSSDDVAAAVQLIDQIDLGFKRHRDTHSPGLLLDFGSKSQRDGLWRGLLRDAIERESGRDDSGAQDLDDRSRERFDWLLEKTLSTPPRER